jgi:hypothetical protein
MTDACRYEREVLHAIEENRWTDTLRMHVAGCDDCAASMSVAPWMDRFSAVETRERPLPDPTVVWLKAKVMGGSVAVERAVRPMQAFHFVAYFLVAAGWAALLTWKWTLLQQWLFSFSPTHAFVNAANGVQLSVTFFLTIFVLSSMTIVLALHTILAEE